MGIDSAKVIEKHLHDSDCNPIFVLVLVMVFFKKSKPNSLQNK